MIGYDVEKEGRKQILDGTFVSQIGTPKYMQTTLDYLRKLQMLVDRGPISTFISTQEDIQRWKGKKERTTSYHGELNFNDFKTGSQDDHISQLDCLSR